MPSHPSGTAPDKPRDPKRSSTGKPPKQPPGDDHLDADAAEPVPHEHLPSRSDDN
jgi:hypothetical protein